MSSTVHSINPYPSVPLTKTIPSGRGGIGNYHRKDSSTRTPPTTATATSTATGPASASPLFKSPRAFTSGRGGAGNVHYGSELAIFSFDEELEMVRMAVTPVYHYHVGRGGAGNYVDERSGSYTSASMWDEGSSVGSGWSVESVGAETVRRNFDWAREMLRRRDSERY